MEMLDCFKTSSEFNTFHPGIKDRVADSSFNTSQMEQKREIKCSQLIPKREDQWNKE